MAMLTVAQRDLTLREVLARDDWRPVHGANVNVGFTAATVWLTGALCNPGRTPVTRWLAVGTPRLESVTFFREGDATRGGAPPLVAGNHTPLAARAVAALLPVFPITLAPGERIRWALRVQSRSAVAIVPTLWEPTAYRQHEGLALVGTALLAAIALLVALFSLAQAWSWRDRGFLLLATWMTLALLYALAFDGYLYRYVFVQGGAWAVRAPGTLGSLASLCYVAVTLAFTGLARVPLWRWVYRGFVGLLLLAVGWTAWGDYRAGALYANGVGMAFYAVWFVSLLDAWRRGLPHARVFLLCYTPVWVSVALGMLQVQGVLDWAPLRHLHTSWLPGLCVMGMVGLLATRRAQQLHTAHAVALNTYLRAQDAAQARLEQAVSERTTALRAALAGAEQARRAKADFLASISHDLRTPLTTILGQAELLQSGGGAPAERARLIRSSGQHMLTMVSNLIDYARDDALEAAEPTAVYLHAMLETIAHTGAELARRHDNQFTFSVEGTPPPVVALDADGLYRVLGNLLDNASKYTRHGTIRLHVAFEGGDARDGGEGGEAVDAGASAEARAGDAVPCRAATLRYQVSDTGPGIDPADHQRILEPFTRLANAQGLPGIGMGLAIAHRWVTRQGGTLVIESARGAGTTVRVTVPARVASEVDVAHPALTAVACPGPDIDGTGRRLWLAEDTAEIRHLLEDRLSALGFAVEAFADGRALIARLHAPHTARPDAVLTDGAMPHADGMAVLRAARAWRAEVPVVLLSAWPLPDTADGAPARPSFDAVLRKPIDFSELQRTLAHLLGLGATAAPAPVPPAAPGAGDERAPVGQCRASHRSASSAAGSAAEK
ncbi:hybrid sensor histidine kinase/response regulator [Pandoraea oxalativorans]|uniref:histidine kinase n=1 Tax=Pandoraea oxalativorans TaxID=573737 RepID=A0A192B138_9BURK|nr:sensor histidine kinase [Pandoraea oxalativorans]ANJ86799.1 hypothetical protein MB84_28435 [Pandoraea oxalativorans]